MDLFSRLNPAWREVLADELGKPYISSLEAFIESERHSSTVPIYPSEDNVFEAFRNTSFKSTKVVILGQDPYHGENQADGLCFSVPEGEPFPPSLRNIFIELHDDLGVNIPKHGNLDSWAKQGVLLLNAILTVRQGQPLSHKGKGWENFSHSVVEKLAQRKDPPIILLWGKEAQMKGQFLARYPQVIVLTAAHPSPLSSYRGFFGCRHFSKVNAILEQQGKTVIAW